MNQPPLLLRYAAAGCLHSQQWPVSSRSITCCMRVQRARPKAPLFFLFARALPRPAWLTAYLVLGPDLADLLSAATDVVWDNRLDASAVRTSAFFTVRLDQDSVSAFVFFFCHPGRGWRFLAPQFQVWSCPVSYSPCQEPVRGDTDVREQKRAPMYFFRACVWVGEAFRVGSKDGLLITGHIIVGRCRPLPPPQWATTWRFLLR